ncbi:MAG TPA: C4-type zinc ribbon domain-containing protein [Vicinamibacterales bacterium]|nr:C4-type zinc ribbon domain-containing protein [Vicinamibacterales bacterium]
MIPALQALVALQQLDSAADAARRRQAELPATEQALTADIQSAEEAVETANARLADNQTQRRALEKDVAGVDSRMARFNDHKAAVKTNQEYTALLHEIETAKADKDAVEEKILVLLEEADTLTASFKAAESALAARRREADEARAALAVESRTLGAELVRLSDARKGEVTAIEPPLLARYEQLLKGRKGVAVAAMKGETCSACFVRLRPHVAQQIRRNDAIHQCESCQRILYYVPPVEGEASTA